ncbi:MAG: DNA mismatch repair endonuclease MutL [Alphaproteobacteria bacterium]|nr:DNA mismatch repair endonuclease MutL [Alphaproteobacteria bacterium]
MSKIHILSDELISQIAAGEIIERPASIIKELIENSIDANSNRIDLFIQDSGRTKIVIEDNGNGISPEDLSLAIKRHATSKLNDNNLMGITTYGFRGEALPSIASVSKLKIESNGFEISVDFAQENDIIQSNFTNGTKITVSNLFDKLPARLKFLRSDNIELTHCISVIENFALTHPLIEFCARDNKKILCSFNTNYLEDRISTVIGSDLFSRAIYILEENDIMKLEGYLFHPMDSKYSQTSQKIFINNRAVKDKIVSAAVKNAYKDIIPAGRFALCVLFININPFYLDVNVSPTKSEIRFRDTNYIQKFISDAIKKNLNKFDRISLTVDNSKLGFKEDGTYIKQYNFDYTTLKQNNNKMQLHDITYDSCNNNIKAMAQQTLDKRNIINDEQQEKIDKIEVSSIKSIIEKIDNDLKNINNINTVNDEFFGEPIGQFANTYIICKTNNELVIIDQHAVHEKIKMENIKSSLSKDSKQYVIDSIKLELNNKQIFIANNIINKLNDLGFNININKKILTINAIPNILKDVNIERFFYDILEGEYNINEMNIDDCLRMRIATSACHNSIRAGRILSINEMKETINEMKKTFSIHQCNHNRPSFIKITLQQLNNIFKRS